MVKMRAKRRTRIRVCYERHAAALGPVALLICGDAARGRRALERAFCRAVVAPGALSSEDLDASVLRALVACAPRRRRGATGDTTRDALMTCRRRERCALVLTQVEGLDESGAADALGCSPGTLRALSRSGLQRMRRASGVTEPAAAIAALLDGPGGGIGSAPPPSASLTRAIAWRRAATTGTMVLALALATTLAVDVARRGPSRGPLALAPEDLLGGPATLRPSDYTHAHIGACPLQPGRLRTIGTSAPGARAAALRLNRALVLGDTSTASSLTGGASRTAQWARTESIGGLRVTDSRRATGAEVARFGCVPRVARSTWRVLLQDESGPSARGIAVYYLQRTDGGWRAWGSYEPPL